MKTEIDSGSGFCFGVVLAIQKAEIELKVAKKMYCLGDIVHNSVEVQRLKSIGLETIDNKQLHQLKNCTVLIRAHGEPPETYKIAKKNNINLIDATCPVVLKLQNKIKETYKKTFESGGQVVIYGKKGHAEVNGLVGQTDEKAIVVENISDIEQIDFSKPIQVFSQTTKSPIGYKEVIKEIKKRISSENKNDLVVHDTICKQVSKRDEELKKFSKEHDVILFVSGKKSSNGKMLYQVCKQTNPLTYFVSEIDDLNSDWFKNCNSVGICGATSTPRWLMEKVEQGVNEISLS